MLSAIKRRLFRRETTPVEGTSAQVEQPSPPAVAPAQVEPISAKAEPFSQPAESAPIKGRTAAPASRTVPPHRLHYRSPAAHAKELLRYMREEGGRTGEILAVELQQAHAEMCIDLGWQIPSAWNAIGRELNYLTGGRKTYAWVNGHRLRVYRIEPTPEPVKKRKARKPTTAGAGEGCQAAESVTTARAAA